MFTLRTLSKQSFQLYSKQLGLNLVKVPQFNFAKLSFFDSSSEEEPAQRRQESQFERRDSQRGGDRQGSFGRGQRGDSYGRDQRQEGYGRDRGDRYGGREGSDRGQRQDRFDQADRYDRSARFDRSDRGEQRGMGRDYDRSTPFAVKLSPSGRPIYTYEEYYNYIPLMREEIRQIRSRAA